MTSSYFLEQVSSPLEPLTPSSPSTPSIPKANALHTRVNNVLSGSFADLDIRDSLAILDERGVSNTAEARRNFRLDVQDELIQCNGEIVRDFAHAAAQLQRVGLAINSLKSSCAAMRKHIAASHRETAPMLDEAKTILTEKSQVENRQHILNAFNEHFIISDADLASLTSSAEPVNDNFFKILTRVKKIHEDCQILLGGENQRLGLEILEQSTRQLNGAFNKLYRWIQREFKSLDLEAPQITAAIRRALRVLAERPTMFQNCLDFFAEARETVLANNFYAALTGAPVDRDHPVMGKAIELSAHDPLRYVGDMLAWAHSATVSEREALESLFISEGDEIAKSIMAGIESEPWTQATQIFDGRSALNDLVNRDLAGVCRHLKQRTEQVIQSHEDAILVYRISNLILFYCNIFASLLGEQATLLTTLRPVSETALRSFNTIMRDHITQLQVDHFVNEDDLSPPEFLDEALETLKALMKSYDTSTSSNDRRERIEGFQPILEQALDPYLAGCESISKRLYSPGNHVFALNYLTGTRIVLNSYTFADRTEELQPKIDEQIALLTTATHKWFSHESGLAELVDNYNTIDDLAELYTDTARLLSIAQSLDTFLPTANEDARAFLNQLEDKTIMRKVIEDAAERFCEDFEEIESLLIEADEKRTRLINGVEDSDDVLLRDIFTRTNDEIRVLLS